ncbi:helix-turn-helix domain-containing protein [Citreimonas salinaria]|uniref:Replication protein C N-terminal domain-containing protein n=1 Tax=Citreimonas salinaria TaxID=321339 RepID=A0A1H3NAX6_9RHOB|nr:helix-turn-helix domain-containing protein [Citreimonas salinaria]SDY85998.1 Replication protein C N-terminal domain-containing protein [Citreimonas salinaria]
MQTFTSTETPCRRRQEVRPAPCPAPTQTIDARPSTLGLDRWVILDRVTAVARHLGLTDRDISVLRVHLTVLRKGPIGPETFPISFMQVERLAERAGGMEPRTFHRGEVRLERAGLIARRLSPNGRRFPLRDPNTDEIVDAYGIDLSPLFASLPKLERIAAQAAKEARQLRNRLTSISSTLSRLKQIVRDAPSWATDPVADLVRLYDRLRKRKAPSGSDLELLEARIADALSTIARSLDEPANPEQAPCPTPSCETTQQNWVATSASVITPNAAVECSSLSDRMPGAAGHCDLPFESKPKEYKETRAADTEALKRVWRQLPALSEWFPSPPASKNEVAGMLFDFSKYLGLRQETVADLVSTIGAVDSMYCLDTLTKRIATIANPNAYLASMLKAWKSGQTIADGRVRRYA